MKKNLLFLLLLLLAGFMHAQNNNCSGATTLTVGTSFSSNAVTSTTVGATTDGSVPSCNSGAVENVWFKVIVPANGNLKIETQAAAGVFDDTVLTVYTGTCSSLTEIACNDDNPNGSDFYSYISLTGQNPGATLYISVWKYNASTTNGTFKISAYNPPSPVNDGCSSATALTVGTNFNSNAVTSTNVNANTDGSVPSCNSSAVENVWFKVVVPASGNLTIETQSAGGVFDDSVMNVYSGTCAALTEVACNDDNPGSSDFFSLVSLTNQVPGSTLYVSVWKYNSFTDNGTFKISAYNSGTLSTHELTGNKTKIKLFPNPFKDIVSVSDLSEVKSITITDVSGKLIKLIEKPSSAIYLGDLKDGLYLISLKMNNGSSQTIKAIKK